MKLLVLYFMLGLSLASALPHQSGYHQPSDELLEELIFPEDRSTKIPGENLNGFRKSVHNIFSSIKNLPEQGINKIRQLLKKEPKTATSTETGVSGDIFSLKDLFTRLRNFLLKGGSLEKFKDLVEKLLPKSKVMVKSIFDIFKKYGKNGRDVLIDFFNRYLNPKKTSSTESVSMEKSKRETSAHGEFQPRKRTVISQDTR